MLGVVGAVLAVATVASTAMIYASPGSIPQWRNRLVLPCHLALPAMMGALLLLALAHGFGGGRRIAWIIAVAAIALGWAIKWAYWRHIDRLPARVGASAGTGLGRLGRLRLLDPSLTAGGFGKAEMGGDLGRSRAVRLRRVATALLFAAPLALTLLQPLLAGAVATVTA